jgi:MraZ protein
VGKNVQLELHRGGKWVRFAPCGPGWRGSSHSSTPARSLFFRRTPALHMAFRGTFDHTLDAKNRLTVPAKFRASLSQGVVIAKGVEQCGAIWLPADYEAYVDRALGGLNPMTRQARDLERFFGANAFETELDAAGRIMIPAPVMEWAGLRKDVVVTGVRTCLELWDRDAWSGLNTELATNVPALTEALGQV